LHIVAMFYRPDRMARPAPWAQPIGPSDLWSDDPADDQFLTLSYSTGGGFLTLSTIKPYEGPLTIGRGQLLDYWIGQDGRLYARNGGATPFPYEAV